MVQLMPTKVMPTLLLSFHFCLTREHAMPQVHSRFRDMAAKHRDGRDKRPRHEVNACPSCHACIEHLYTLQAFFIISSLASIARLVSREGPERPPKVPHVHEPTRCDCCFLKLNMQQMTLGCTGIGLREVYERPTPSVCDGKPPSSTPRALA